MANGYITNCRVPVRRLLARYPMQTEFLVFRNSRI